MKSLDPYPIMSAKMASSVI